MIAHVARIRMHTHIYTHAHVMISWVSTFFEKTVVLDCIPHSIVQSGLVLKYLWNCDCRYGPETYNIKQVIPGKYLIRAHYYGSHQQTLVGPATIKATVFSNYGRIHVCLFITIFNFHIRSYFFLPWFWISKGRQNEIRKELTLRLDGVEKIVTIGELSLGDDVSHVQVGTTVEETWCFLAPY